MLVDLIWVVVWFVALLLTLVVADTIANDREFNDYAGNLSDEGRTRLVAFFATPALWAIIIVFYFN